jgi:hypothetical protein
MGDSCFITCNISFYVCAIISCTCLLQGLYHVLEKNVIGLPHIYIFVDSYLPFKFTKLLTILMTWCYTFSCITIYIFWQLISLKTHLNEHCFPELIIVLQVCSRASHVYHRNKLENKQINISYVSTRMKITRNCQSLRQHKYC